MPEKSDNVDQTQEDDVKEEGEKEGVNSPTKIVGIGASAGGLEALEKFFFNMNPDSGMGFVIIQHLSPDHKSLMADLLGKTTQMRVMEAQEAMRIEPNSVYLIPSGKTMTVKRGCLFLEDREPKPTLSMPIDIFFLSLAKDQGSRAVGVILSGNGSDGTLGIQAIKEARGLVYVQDAGTAQFSGMPQSAIGTNKIDFVAPPEQLPDAILNNVKANVESSALNELRRENPLNRALRLLLEQTGVDFTFYKKNTITRRIERRMQATQFSTLEDYTAVLAQSPDEIDLLFKDMLIGVTQFFRDADAFDELKRRAIRPLVVSKKHHETIRVWIPGCSTGEEAYSIAMLFREVKNETGSKVNIKIFATDIDQDAIDFASRGIYVGNTLDNLSPERLEAFFNQRGRTYEVKRYLREMIVFAKQNLLKDPPFSRIDLISCRNLLIYFENPFQTKAYAIFRFSLNQKGYLLLGPSEVLDTDNGYQTINAHWRIYKYTRRNRRYAEPVNEETQVAGQRFVHQYDENPQYNKRQHTQLEADNLLYKGLLESTSSASILVDENRSIKHAFGNLQPFLRLPTGGRIEFDVVNMARDQITVPLSTAIHKASNRNQRVVYSGIQLEQGKKGGSGIYELVATPYYDVSQDENLVYISFQEQRLDNDGQQSNPSFNFAWDESIGERIYQLEQELKYTKENLQATIEELETSNEELQATNEELLASNEELQSTNEELQSVNEELLTVNAEYQTKISELTELNNDISNLFNSTEVGTIFLDEHLNIRKFTPVAKREINLIEQDLGRPLSHISHNLVNIDLVGEATSVLNTLIVREKEVQNEQGMWFILKTIPYRTTENVIKGVVITLVDISQLKRAQEELAQLAEQTRQNEIKFHQALQFSRIAIFHQDRELKYIWVYNPFPKFPGYEDRLTIGKTDEELFLEEDAKKLTDLKRSVLVSGIGDRLLIDMTIQNEKVYYDLFVEPLENEEGEVIGVACVSIDVTERDKVNIES